MKQQKRRISRKYLHGIDIFLFAFYKSKNCSGFRIFAPAFQIQTVGFSFSKFAEKHTQKKQNKIVLIKPCTVPNTSKSTENRRSELSGCFVMPFANIPTTIITNDRNPTSFRRKDDLGPSFETKSNYIGILKFSRKLLTLSQYTNLISSQAVNQHLNVIFDHVINL